MNDQKKRHSNSHPLECLVMLTPHVEPEHKEMIEKAETILREYEESLCLNIKKEYSLDSEYIRPTAEKINAARRAFFSDIGRQAIIKHLVNIKGIFEKPRCMIKAI